MAFTARMENYDFYGVTVTYLLHTYHVDARYFNFEKLLSIDGRVDRVFNAVCVNPMYVCRPDHCRENEGPSRPQYRNGDRIYFRDFRVITRQCLHHPNCSRFTWSCWRDRKSTRLNSSH